MDFGEECVPGRVGRQLIEDEQGVVRLYLPDLAVAELTLTQIGEVL